VTVIAPGDADSDVEQERPDEEQKPVEDLQNAADGKDEDGAHEHRPGDSEQRRDRVIGLGKVPAQDQRESQDLSSA
jgi:hypothetical protein